MGIRQTQSFKIQAVEKALSRSPQTSLQEVADSCSGLIAPDTLIRDNNYQRLRCPVLLDHYNITLRDSIYFTTCPQACFFVFDISQKICHI